MTASSAWAKGCETASPRAAALEIAGNGVHGAWLHTMSISAMTGG